jgi:hypothetical protein
MQNENGTKHSPHKAPPPHVIVKENYSNIKIIYNSRCHSLKEDERHVLGRSLLITSTLPSLF